MLAQAINYTTFISNFSWGYTQLTVTKFIPFDSCKVFALSFLPESLGNSGLAWEGLVGSCKFAPVDDNLKIYWELSLV